MIHPQFSEVASHISAEGICDALVELVNIASPTGHEAGVAGYLLDRMQKAGLDAEPLGMTVPAMNTPETFTAFMHKELERQRELAKLSGHQTQIK